MPNQVISLNQSQVQQLASYQAAGSYAEAYRYLSQVYSSNGGNDPRMTTWLGLAAQINSNDGGGVSEFVRGATIAASYEVGRPISREDFQRASDVLADSVIRDVLNNNGSATFPPFERIIANDVNTAVRELGLPAWAWAGTLGSIFPLSMNGLDYNALGNLGNNPFEIGVNAVAAAAANGVGGIAAGWALWAEFIGEAVGDSFDPYFESLESIFDQINSFFNNFLNWQPRRDPLSLDLDGDGLESLAESGSSGVLFDHDADGVKAATGWIGRDDAFLVRDLNGNGQIDSGRELFGDSTRLSNGALARNGFEALIDLDANADGKVDASDAAFASLRVWQDSNSNGVADAGELRTLQEAGVVALNTAHQTGSTNLGNGNELAERGTYQGTDNRVGILGDLNFRESNFHRVFIDSIAPTAETRGLANTQGAGRVRDLREAATQSQALAALVEQYMAAPTRAAQMALMPALLSAWADTAGMRDLRERFGLDYRSDSSFGPSYMVNLGVRRRAGKAKRAHHLTQRQKMVCR